MSNALSKYFSDLYSGNKKLNFKEIPQLLKENKEEIKLLNLADFLSYLSNHKYDPFASPSDKIVLKTIKYLVKNGINVNLKSKNGYTPLAYAIRLDNSLILLDFECRLTKFLIENGANINQEINIKLDDEEKIKISPLMFSAYHNPYVTKVLLEYGAKLENDYKVFYTLSNEPYDESYPKLYNDDRGFLQVAIDLQAHDLIELVVKKHIEENIPFAKGYCLNPLFDLQKVDEIGNVLIETKEESQQAVNRIIKTLKLFENTGVRVFERFYEFILQEASKPIATDYDNTICLALDLRKKLYRFDRGESTLTLLKHLVNVGVKIDDEDIRKSIFELSLPDTTVLLINNGANVNAINYYADKYKISLLMEVCLSEKLHHQKFKFIQLLVENGANIHYKDSIENTVLFKLVDAYQDTHHIDQYYDENGEMKTETFLYPEAPSEKIMKYLIEKGVNINVKNNLGMTPLMHYASKGNKRLVKILLDAGADITPKSEMTAFDLATNDDIKDMIANTKNHEPQKLVKLLSNFTIDKPMKHITHAWDFGELSKSTYQNFDGFINAVKNQWNSIENTLEELSPNLCKKINTFLFEANPDKDYSWCSQAHINIGWSSLDGLKEWCDGGNDPFNFKFKNRLRVNNKTINTFGKVIDLFKQEIEMRDDFKTLLNILNNLKKKFKGKLEIDYDTNKFNKQFYTNTQMIEEAFTIMLQQMETRAQSDEECIQVEISLSYPENGYYEFKIIQKNSFSPLEVEELLVEVQNGDFAEIENKLFNLCDWSVENRIENENVRINYLKSNNVKDIEKLEHQVEGFTHILRFYK